MRPLALLSFLAACDPLELTRLGEPAPRELDADICDAPCDAGAINAAGCCTERFVHGNGASIGWARRGAAMFTIDDPEDAGVVLAALKRWVSERPARAGLPTPMANTDPLAGLTVGPVPPRRHGSLVVHRFTQTYRDVPVVGAGEHLTLTVSPYYGAINVSGAIVDARDTYDGWGAAISPASALAAAAKLLALEGGEIEKAPFTFGAPRLVAVAEAHALAWEIHVARFGHSRGTLLLGAGTGAMLAYWPAAHYAPEDEVAVTVRARTFASDFLSLQNPDQQIVADLDEDPVTGEPLLGSVYSPLACDEDPAALATCGQTRLGNRHIIALDADHQNFKGDNSSHPYIGATPDGKFLATPPASADDYDAPMRRDAALQDYFYRLQAVYSLIDGYHAGKWDPHRASASDFPALEFKPRIVLAINTDVQLTCGQPQPGCAKMYRPSKYDFMTEQEVYDEHPEADLPAHVWKEGLLHDEGMGFMGMGVDGFSSPDLVFHEFGHIVDLFTVKGLISQVIGSGCPDKKDGEKMCVAACVPDSTDEAPALSETVADMFSLFSVGRLYSTVPHGRCQVVSNITAASGPVHDAACMDAPDDIKSFLDQRPTDPGMVEHDGLWLPTGLCSHAPGYKQSAILQAWWEWTHARDCSPAPPFACDSFAGEETGARSGMEALLFAMSQSSNTYYRKLFTDMETYITCTAGPQRGSQFRRVFCHHGALDCVDLPPVCPAICGNGTAELTEACDGEDLRGETCFDHGLGGDEPACNADCTFDLSPCVDEPGTSSGSSGTPPTTTSPDVPTMGWDPAASSSGSAEESEDTAAEQATEGCGCRHGANILTGWLALALLARRRRRMDGAADRGVR